MVFSFLKHLFPCPQTRQFRRTIYTITSYRPRNLALYKLAFQHGAIPGVTASNERLEFLGDAVLSLIIGEYLFQRYPLEEEGFLTEIRARIVNRASLGQLARKIGIDSLIQYNNRARHKGGFKFVDGNALEALIGAVYLDQGYKRCQQFVIERLLKLHIDLEALIQNDTNYKSQLIIWANRNRKKVTFQLVDEQWREGAREFTVQAMLDGTVAGRGQGRNKKQAEQKAAHMALQAREVQ